MTTLPRRIFQLDGLQGGVLHIAERPHEGCVVLMITTADAETRIALSQDDFSALAELRYSLRFAPTESLPDQTALKAVA